MDMKPIAERFLDIMQNHHKRVSDINKIIKKENPMLTVLVSTLNKEVNQIMYILFDLLEVPADYSNYDCIHNCPRYILEEIIHLVLEDPDKYKKVAIEIILDWKNLDKYIEPVEKYSCFSYERILEKHPNYSKK